MGLRQPKYPYMIPVQPGELTIEIIDPDDSARAYVNGAQVLAVGMNQSGRKSVPIQPGATIVLELNVTNETGGPWHLDFVLTNNGQKVKGGRVEGWDIAPTTAPRWSDKFTLRAPAPDPTKLIEGARQELAKHLKLQLSEVHMLGWVFHHGQKGAAGPGQLQDSRLPFRGYEIRFEAAGKGYVYWFDLRTKKARFQQLN